MTKTERQMMKLKMHKRLTLIRENMEHRIPFISEVKGKLILPNGDILDTIENENYLLDCGLYTLKYEYSPKFKRHLWELKGTEPRTEIKFHKGTKAEHSKGCILLRSNALDYLHNILDSNKVYKIKIR